MKVEQLTREQAIEIANSKAWESWSFDEIVKFQLFQECLCMPFDKFQEAVEAVFNRPVFTHEFASQERLINEYESLNK